MILLLIVLMKNFAILLVKLVKYKEMKQIITNNNCIKCKDEFELESNISNSKYKNCNKNETIQEIINNLINKFNMTELDSGKDRKKIIDKNKVIILTSTENQKNNEDKNITIDLGQCENILKTEYNISNNE